MRFTLLSLISFIFISCNSQNTDPTLTGSSSAPVIKNVSAQKINDAQNEFSIEISGENLGGVDWNAHLESKENSSAPKITLSTGTISQSSARVFVSLGSALKDGLYNLVIANAHGQDLAPISVLKGDKGEKGLKGDKGDAGAQGVAGKNGVGVWSKVFSQSLKDDFMSKDKFVSGASNSSKKKIFSGIGFLQKEINLGKYFQLSSNCDYRLSFYNIAGEVISSIYAFEHNIYEHENYEGDKSGYYLAFERRQESNTISLPGLFVNIHAPQIEIFSSHLVKSAIDLTFKVNYTIHVLSESGNYDKPELEATLLDHTHNLFFYKSYEELRLEQRCAN